MALPLNNSAEGQTSGTAVAAGGTNTGGGSGDQFDEAVTGTNMALTFDNGHPAHGANAYKIAQNSTTPAITYVGWSATVFGSAVTTIYGRLYFWIATLPVNSSIRLVEFFFGASTVVGWIGFASGANTFHFRSAADAAIGTQSGAISAATLYRIEFQATTSTTVGAGTGKIYAGDSLTTAVTDFSFSALSWGTASGINHVRFGMTTANYEILSGKTFSMDDFNLNSTGLPGPAIPAVKARQPVIVNQAVMRGLTRMQKLTKRKSGLYVPAEWSEKILVPA